MSLGPGALTQDMDERLPRGCGRCDACLSSELSSSIVFSFLGEVLLASGC